MTHEEKRQQRLQRLDDHVGRWMCETEASREVKSAPGWGKPFDFGGGCDETPPELRLAFKTLKDAGFVPRGVGMMNELAAFKLALATVAGDAQRHLRRRVAELRAAIVCRIEALRGKGSL